MRVVGLCGPSGSGKTTLAEGLIAAFKARGLRVSVVKHAHKRFDIDLPGKDSWRHRQAGAFEVVIANDHRLAKVREFESPEALDVHQMLAELIDLGPAHWVLVEGFKHASLHKIEVWRGGSDGLPLYARGDAHVIAVAAKAGEPLPVPTGLPVLDLDRPEQIVDHLLQDPRRHDYEPAPHVD
ncbi:molybdopterin-guanine dinucleotide biosynthesis protein B [Leptothrix discophora]|uniref:Molybdopterin-guanine dinucleotide biosynthesis protein B n=1 Tax=Leptothrix discophora TaxID=89 RepID=A0ABT9FYV9_LEPDI|nr:molybdopterin-guanine dinucleotide biosynthesis protein B [Leptothrix discophora]MDP4299410.1 molybdopterin-guanine dinucleotide biosynthesis protein B [Leptothrix discophora]